MRSGPPNVWRRPGFTGYASYARIVIMLLDKLLDYVKVHAEPFATCLLSSGWRLRLPGPPETMFHFVMQGSGYLRGPDGVSVPLEQYFLAVVPKGIQHSLECGLEVQSEEIIQGPPPVEGVVRFVAGSPTAAEFRVACGMVSVTYGDSLGLFKSLREIIVADLSAYPQVCRAFEGILAEQSSATQGSVTLTRALMTQCIVYLFRHLSEESDGRLPWLSGLEDPNLARAIDVIFERPEAAHTVDSLAEVAIMSRSVFAERFRATFGSTPINFLHDVRLRRAADFLRRTGETSIEQVAHRVGFNSRSHFSQAFKDHFGISPAAFRQHPELL